MSVSEYQKKIDEAARFLADGLDLKPTVGIILGTGLGGLADRIEKHKIIPYRDIPHFPESTVESHAGQLIAGHLGGKAVLAFQGRFHFYEGYSLEEVTFPVRVLATLGVRALILSNAAGGLNPLFKPGDLMIIRDHINLMGVNPLRGPNVDEWGLRFPDMSMPYDRTLCAKAEEVALASGLPVQKGVYVAVSGPSLETPAETRFLRMIGADAVGMSTVPEVIVANHAGLKVFAVSVIANVNLPECMQPIHLEDVIATAGKTEPNLVLLVSRLLKAMKN